MRALLLLPFVAACYAPDVVDCTLACEAAGDCAEGQVCGADHLCAAPEMAGHCKQMTQPTDDKVPLRVTISGHGKVAIDSFGMCDSNGATDGDCTVMVPKNIVRHLTAIPTDEDRSFERWTTTNCAGQDSSCTLTPTGATLVGAKFH